MAKGRKITSEPDRTSIEWSDNRFGWITRAVLLNDHELLLQLEYMEDGVKWNYSTRLQRTGAEYFNGSWSCSDGAGKTGSVTATLHAGAGSRFRLEGTRVEARVQTTWQTDDFILEKVSSDES